MISIHSILIRTTNLLLDMGDMKMQTISKELVHRGFVGQGLRKKFISNLDTYKYFQFYIKILSNLKCIIFISLRNY